MQTSQPNDSTGPCHWLTFSCLDFRMSSSMSSCLDLALWLPPSSCWSPDVFFFRRPPPPPKWEAVSSARWQGVMSLLCASSVASSVTYQIKMWAGKTKTPRSCFGHLYSALFPCYIQVPRETLVQISVRNIEFNWKNLKKQLTLNIYPKNVFISH